MPVGGVVLVVDEDDEVEDLEVVDEEDDEVEDLEVVDE